MKHSRLIIFGVLILDVISIGIMIPAFDAMRTFYHLAAWTGSIGGYPLTIGS